MKALLLTLFLIALPAPTWATLYGPAEELRFWEGGSSGMARSVAAMIPKARAMPAGGGAYLLRGSLLERSENLCEGEPFAEKISLSTCTGFLVSEDLLLTAGHCVASQAECENHLWLFDYLKSSASEEQLVRPDSHRLAACSRLEARVVNDELDLALLRLDRSTGRPGLKIGGETAEGALTTVEVLGHPLGMPLARSGPGQVIGSATEPSYLLARVNAFHKNSGSPVFAGTLESGKVAGVLISGNRDFSFRMGSVFDPKCNRFFRCEPGDATCSGEKILSAEMVRKFLEGARRANHPSEN